MVSLLLDIVKDIPIFSLDQNRHRLFINQAVTRYISLATAIFFIERTFNYMKRLYEYGYSPPFTFFLIDIYSGRKYIIEKTTMGGLFNKRSNC